MLSATVLVTAVFVAGRALDHHDSLLSIADLPEHDRQLHSGPFTATGEAVRILNRRSRRHSNLAVWAGCGAVSVALDEMKPRYRRKTFQLLQGENQRTIHHPMDHEPVLARIDIRRIVTMRKHEME